MGKSTAKMQYIQKLLLKFKDQPPKDKPIILIASEGDSLHGALEKWLAEQGVVKGNKPSKEVTEGHTYLMFSHPTASLAKLWL